ncbi:MAG: hypothetical protein E6501_35960, partial [Bradyrhizobium sp.]|nr:hypothetical protein [Bradyrhizobium sp.]
MSDLASLETSILDQIAAAGDEAALEAVRVAALGKKGSISALLATLACLALGYPFAWFLARLPQKVRPLLLFLLIVPFWTNSLIRIYGLKIFLST